MQNRKRGNRQQKDARSRNDIELSPWSCVSVTWVACPAKTTLYLNTKSNNDPHANPTTLTLTHCFDIAFCCWRLFTFQHCTHNKALEWLASDKLLSPIATTARAGYNWRRPLSLHVLAKPCIMCNLFRVKMQQLTNIQLA